MKWPLWLVVGILNAFATGTIHALGVVPSPFVAAGYGYSWAFVAIAIYDAATTAAKDPLPVVEDCLGCGDLGCEWCGKGGFQ